MPKFEVRIYHQDGDIWCQLRDLEPFKINGWELEEILETIFDWDASL